MPPRLQCHRGLWVGGVRENTLASLRKAYEAGYQISEFDIRITQDQKVILFHDDFIKGQKISKMTLAQMSKLMDVDTFESVLKWHKKTREIFVSPLQKKNSNLKYSFYLNIEIKSKFVRDRRLEKQVLDLILKYGVQDSVLVSSFNPLSLFYFRKNYPAITRALLLTYNNDHGNNFVVKSQILNFFAFPHFLHLDEKYWRKNKYKKLLDFKVPVVLWTCNDLDKVEKYFKQGIYGVISDRLTPEEINKIT